MRKKTLTRDRVIRNGWDKLEVITADMLEGYTEIGYEAFEDCTVKEITLPETITDIGCYAFESCKELEEVIFKGEKIEFIGSSSFANCRQLKYLKLPKDIDFFHNTAFCYCPIITSKFEIQDYSKPVVAYKGFYEDMTCMNGFQYEEGKTYESEGEPKLCKCGFHACLNPLDVFSYYYYYLFSKCVYYEVILEGVSKERLEDSKVVAKKITIGRKLTMDEMIEIFNKKVNGEN